MAETNDEMKKPNQEPTSSRRGAANSRRNDMNTPSTPPTEPQPPQSLLLWHRIKVVTVEHIGTAIGVFIASSFLAGAIASWAAIKTWVIRDTPSGLVIASLKECRELTGGWETFNSASGRFIIGAGVHNNKNTKSYAVFTTEGVESPIGLERATGGFDTKKLSVEEMPSHDHVVYPHAGHVVGNVPDTSPGAGGDDPIPTSRVRTSRTTMSGGNQSFSILPPYIALYYCKKL